MVDILGYPNRAEVDLKALKFNLRQVKNRVGEATKVMAVVKADGYGHGMIKAARAFVEEGADYLGVAFPGEGAELRNNGFNTPILVFGSSFPDQISLFLEHNLEATLVWWDFAEALDKECFRLGKRVMVHVKVDTGMGRVGVSFRDAPSFVERVSKLSNIELVGLYTHFATSDERDKSFARLQLKRFEGVIQGVEKLGIGIPLKHTANSGAILDLPESYYDMVRPGIMLYGYYPSPHTSESLPLRPALKWVSKISAIKDVEPGTSVSYGRRWVAPRVTTIATVPIGYGDGYPRLLTNKGEVLIKGKRFPVVGTVCMDMIMVDLGENSPVKAGDEVVLMGRAGSESVGADEIGGLIGTIPYEVLCGVSKRVPRVYV